LCSSIRPMLRAIEIQLKDVGTAARAIGLQIQIHNANQQR